MLRVEVHPEVYRELEESRCWYEQRAVNLGTDFLAEIDKAIEAVRKSPTTWPWYDEKLKVRRFLVHRFPFAIVYRCLHECVQILAVMHLRRHPDYWKTREPFFHSQ